MAFGYDVIVGIVVASTAASAQTTLVNLPGRCVDGGCLRHVASVPLLRPA